MMAVSASILPHLGSLFFAFVLPMYCTLTLVEAVKAFVDAPAIYQNAPSFAYVIGDYTVSKTGTVSGPANEALMAALNAKGFIVE